MSKIARDCKFYDVALPGKIGVATIFRSLRFSVTFFFPHLPNGTLKFSKFCENSTLRFFVASLLFSIAEEGFRFQLIPRKVRKIVPQFTIFLNTSSSLRRKADAKLIAHWKRSFTRIESYNRVDILTSHLTHNACFNIVPFKVLLWRKSHLFYWSHFKR